jgi:Mn2+/Fe2+ NRAMP family transporter
MIVGGSWSQILTFSIIPHIEIKPEFATMFVAIIGTSISPYLFFWQASEEAEEDVAKEKIKEIGKKRNKINANRYCSRNCICRVNRVGHNDNYRRKSILTG